MSESFSLAGLETSFFTWSKHGVWNAVFLYRIWLRFGVLSLDTLTCNRRNPHFDGTVFNRYEMS